MIVTLLLGCAFLGDFAARRPVDTGAGDSASDSASDTAPDSGADTDDIPDDLPDDPGDEACAEAPVVTWETFGQGFLVEACQPCHASTATARHGAPDGVAFDTEEDAATWAQRILARATGPDADMPPAGGVVDEDRYLLAVWLTCHPPEP